ncbi:MAG TPA: energy transducer TonB, partial [bacterium]|nr:energy transducer TonB [bacterium]
AALLALLAAVAGSGPRHAPVEIYSIHIMEAPAAPQAHALPIEPPESLAALPPPAPLKVPAPSVPGTAPALSGPPPLVNAPGAPLPAAPGRAAASRSLQAIPGLPEPATKGSAAPAAPAPQGPPALPAHPPAAGAPTPGPAPASSSSLEQLRRRVQSLNLKVETAPRTGPGSTAPQTNDTESLLSLRLYQNRVRERVKENYTFPGTFPRTLRTRVQVVINRDGSKRSVMLLESSGNDRFDTLVCMDAVHKAQLPPVPEKIKGDTLTLTLSCSP